MPPAAGKQATIWRDVCVPPTLPVCLPAESVAFVFSAVMCWMGDRQPRVVREPTA